jgi:hypothetical protein
MRSPSQLPRLAGSLLWIGVALISHSLRSEDSFVAMGKVNSDGSLASSASRKGAVVASSRIGVGIFEVSIIQSGAFQNASVDDYVIESGIESGVTSDIGISASVTSVSNDALSVRFYTADLENSASPDDPVATDQGFYFAIRVSPESATIEGFSPHLIAVGNFSGITSIPLAVRGEAFRISRQSAGRIELFLEKTGVFLDDEPDDYLVFLTSMKGGTEDEILSGKVESTFLDSAVGFAFRNDDVQSNPAGDDGLQRDGSISFAIYRMDDAETTKSPASRLIAFMASVTGSNGSRKNGATSRPGSSVITNRSSQGVYTVRLVSPGAFQNTSAREFAPMVTVRGSLLDRAASAEYSVIDEDTLQVTVRIKDVQASGQAEGVLVDNDFDIVVYELNAAYHADLALSNRRNPSSFRSFGSLANPLMTLKPADTRWERFYIGSENAGRSLDGLRFRPFVNLNHEERYFDLGRGRLNITANVRTGQVAVSEIRPGERAYIECGVRFKVGRPPQRHTKWITGYSAFSERPVDESVRVRLLPGS